MWLGSPWRAPCCCRPRAMSRASSREAPSQSSRCSRDAHVGSGGFNHHRSCSFRSLAFVLRSTRKQSKILIQSFFLLSYRRASYSTAINRHPAATEPFNLRASGSMQKLIVWHASACLALCLVAPAANARSQRKLKTTVRTTCRHFWASRHAAGADISSGRGTVA